MGYSAIYGGSFSIFGNHHLKNVKTLAKMKEVENIILVPSVAHAEKPHLPNYVHRRNMAKLGIQGLEKELRASVSDIECDLLMLQKAPIFTVNLLDFLSERAGEGQTFRFALGEDLRNDVKNWEHGDLVKKRHGFIWLPIIRGAISNPKVSFHPEFREIHCSEIRELIRQNSRWEHLVPPAVAHYIKLHNLYK